MMNVTVKYTCSGCGIRDRDVTLPCREPHEDVVVWVQETLGAAIGADHRATSPQCTRGTMDNVKIPVPQGDGWIGGPSVQ
jgi:hypothetical protein